MNLPFQSKPKTLIDRLEAAGQDAIELVRSVPGRLDTSRKHALAVVGGATGAAAGFAFWRSRRDDGPSVHQDSARPKTPWKATPPKPIADTKAAAASAAGTRSK